MQVKYLLHLILVNIMKKLLFSLVIFSFFISIGYGQETSSASSVELHNIVPVSPEAASLGKYGDLPVNLSTGRINYTIPLFTIREGNYELPIYLSYNYSGLLSEEDPGIAGLGWTLHAGGAIVRQLRGIPDETSGIGYVGGNIGKDYVVPFIKETISDIDKRTLIVEGDLGNMDTQPDKFIINAGKISGNFSFNELGSAIFSPNQNYSVQFNETSNDFSIIDDFGNLYEFRRKENTSLESISNNESASFIDYVSSWGLTKIIPQNRQEPITFSYKNGASYQKRGYSESKLTPLANTVGSSFCSNQNLFVRTSLSLTDIPSTRQLSSIKFSQGVIEFDIKEVPHNSLSKNKNYLNKIIIKNKHDKILYSYEFKYDNLLSNFKLLNEIIKKNSNAIAIPFFKMNYKSPPPTTIDYRSQDNLGFYNQKINQNLIEGNRNSSFNGSSRGALTKITYPTGGFTEISYESNRVPKGTFNTCILPKTNTQKQINLYEAGYDQPITKSITFKEDQDIIVKLSTRAYSNSPSEEPENEATIVEATASITGDITCKFNEDCGFMDCRKSIMTIMENGIQLNGGNKEVNAVFSVKANTTLVLSAKLEGYGTGLAYVSVSYYDPDLPEEQSTSKDYVEVGGVRVAQTKDCSQNNDCINKKYSYINEDGSTSGIALFKPVYKNNITYIGAGGQCLFSQKTSNSRIPLSSFQGAPVFYTRVEINYGDNLEGGKVVNEFTYGINPLPLFPFAPFNTKDWKKGNLKKKEIYKKEGDSVFLVSKIENEYTTVTPYPNKDYLKYSSGFLAKRNRFTYAEWTNGASAPLAGNPDFDYGIDYYYDRPEFYHLVQTKTTDYYDDKKTISINNYTYNAPTGLLKDKNIVNSQGDIINTQTKYAHDLNDQRLINEQRVATPLETITYKNGIQLSHQKTVYSVNHNNINSYLPSKVKTLKGIPSPTNELETRIIYHEYDTKGNPLEVSKADGTHIVYIWGYQKSQPIAKIENATLADIPEATITDLQTKSDNDSNATSETTLRTALNSLRSIPSLSNALVTTYTYNPLIGVTSITDPRGETVYYEYDTFNRLILIKDVQGNIIKEHKYNYKN